MKGARQGRQGGGRRQRRVSKSVRKTSSKKRRKKRRGGGERREEPIGDVGDEGSGKATVAPGDSERRAVIRKFENGPINETLIDGGVGGTIEKASIKSCEFDGGAEKGRPPDERAKHDVEPLESGSTRPFGSQPIERKSARRGSTDFVFPSEDKTVDAIM